MANIRKSFNFKNGVQVDNDKFVVNANGLVGIGTTMAFSAVDFRLAGSGAATTTTRYMIPPTVTTDEKVGLGTTAGGIVYDSTLNKLQCFDGTTWNNLF